MAEIRVLKRRQRHEIAAPISICPYEGSSGSYPWYYECFHTHETKEAAFNDAADWATEYYLSDPIGNMANAFGVLEEPGHDRVLYRGVVNYYHSNT